MPKLLITAGFNEFLPVLAFVVKLPLAVACRLSVPASSATEGKGACGAITGLAVPILPPTEVRLGFDTPKLAWAERTAARDDGRLRPPWSAGLAGLGDVGGSGAGTTILARAAAAVELAG